MHFVELRVFHLKSHESAINYQSPLASLQPDDMKRDFKWTVKCAAQVHFSITPRRRAARNERDWYLSCMKKQEITWKRHIHSPWARRRVNGSVGAAACMGLHPCHVSYALPTPPRRFIRRWRSWVGCPRGSQSPRWLIFSKANLKRPNCRVSPRIKTKFGLGLRGAGDFCTIILYKRWWRILLAIWLICFECGGVFETNWCWRIKIFPELYHTLRDESVFF